MCVLSHTGRLYDVLKTERPQNYSTVQSTEKGLSHYITLTYNSKDAVVLIQEPLQQWINWIHKSCIWVSCTIECVLE